MDSTWSGATTSSEARRRGGRGAALVVALGLMLLGGDRAVASFEQVVLSGTGGADAFIVSVMHDDPDTLELCAAFCVTRSRSEIDALVVEGFAGDDLLIVDHSNGFVTNADGWLSITFAGGTGDDWLTLCGAFAAGDCTTPVDTTVSTTAEVDERRIDQVDAAWNSTSITVRGATLIRDETPGSLTVAGTGGDDVITRDLVSDFDADGDPLDLGRVRVAGQAPVWFGAKSSLTLDTGAGADRVDLREAAGLDATASCHGATSAPTCVIADSGADDTVVARGLPATTEAATLVPRAGGSRLDGLASYPAVDLEGVDTVDLTLQPSGGDQFTLPLSSGDDTVELLPDGGSGPLTIRGAISPAGGATPLPTVVLRPDGTASHAVTVAGGGGTDRVVQRGTERTDVIDLRRNGPSPVPACQPSTTCLKLDVAGAAGNEVSLTGIEDHVLEGAAGDDTLRVDATLPASTMWSGGDGHDAVDVVGDGERIGVDLDAATVQHGADGLVTLVAVEDLSLDAATAGLTVASGPTDDVLRVTPVTASQVELTRDAAPLALHARGVGSTLVVEAGEGEDEAVVAASAGADAIAVNRGVDLGVAIADRVPVRINGAEAATVEAGGGDDHVTASGVLGPASLLIDGGVGNDRIDHIDPSSSATVEVPRSPEARVVAGGSALDLRTFETIAVEGTGAPAARLRVSGHDTGDTVVQEGDAVTVARNTTIRHLGFPTLELAGGPAADAIQLAPATTNGVTAIAVAAGDGPGDVLGVRGTALGETISYAPTGATAGSVTVGSAPTVGFGGVEDVQIDGATEVPSGDVLRVPTPGLRGVVTVTPGIAFDSGLVSTGVVTGTATSVPSLRFARLGAGEVVLPGGPEDDVHVEGRTANDTFVVTTRGAGTQPVISLGDRVPVVASAAERLVLEGLDGSDTFRVPTDHGIPGRNGVAVDVRGGSPSDGDTLSVLGAGAPLVSDLGTSTVGGPAGNAGIRHDGLSAVGLDLAGGPLTVRGSTGPEDLSYQPTGAASAVVDGAGVVRHDVGAASDVSVDLREGGDHLTVLGRSTADQVEVTRGTTTGVTTTGLLPLSLAPSVESLTLDTANGTDEITVTGQGGPEAFSVDGGTPVTSGDRLRVVSPDVSVAFASDPAVGQADTPGGAVSFAGIEHLDAVGDGTGALAVLGSAGTDALTIGDAEPPRIELNGSTEVGHRGYAEATVDGRGGADDVSVGLTALGDIRRLAVAGGSASDRLSLADTAGTTRTFTATPSGAAEVAITSSGHPTVVAATSVETMVVDARGGDDTIEVISPAGVDDVAVRPGDVPDAGQVSVGSQLPVSFLGLGHGGALRLGDVSAQPADRVRLEGSPAADTIEVDGPNRRVTRPDRVAVLVPDASDLAVEGRDGDDAVRVLGPLPFATTTVDGGAPDVGDRLHVEGAEDDVVVDLAAATIRGYGGELRFPEVGSLTTDVGGRSLLQHGTDRDDGLCYDAQSPRDGRLYIVGGPAGGTASSVCLPDQRGVNVLHEFIDVGSLLVDPGAGVDEVIVNGTVGRDLMTVDAVSPATMVTLHPEPESGSTFRLPIEVVVATTESLVLAADNGADSIDVTARDSVAPVILVDGEGPETMHIADDLVLRDGTGKAHLRDVNSQTVGSGTATATYRASGNEIRVDYRNIEKVVLYRDPKVDGDTGGGGKGGGKPS